MQCDCRQNPRHSKAWRNVKVSKRGENIYKRKDGRWEARYSKGKDENGKTRYGYIYAKTYSEAKEKVNSVRAHYITPTSVSKVTYGEIVDMWLDRVSIQVKQSTKARYHHVVERYLRPEFGNKRIENITTTVVESFIQTLLCCGNVDHNRGLSAKTVNDIMVIMKATLKYAKSTGYNINCNTEGLYVKSNKKEMCVLSDVDRIKLSRWLMDTIDPCKFGVLLSLFTGIRIGELCALKWEHIRFADGMLLIRSTMQRIQQKQGERKTSIIITEPKSACSRRDIPLPSFLFDIATKLQALPEAYVLTGKTDQFIEPRTMQNRFKKYEKECGIAPVNYHALRHTFATHCVELGFELKSLSEILGHASVNITLNKYVHSSVNLKRRNMEMLCTAP